jgi:ABC-type transport system involved in multi-copper enzyme maturation permease subunit
MQSARVSTSNEFIETSPSTEEQVSSPSFIKYIYAIARNTFRESVRDRILYNLVLFVLLITAAAIFLGELTGGQEARTIVNFGLSAMLLFGAFIAIFVGVALVSKEIEKRTVYAIFSKPVRRGEFIVGKYFGLCLTLLVNVSIMGVGVSLALLYVGGNNLAISIWGAIFLIYLELTILTAIATLFSSFSSPALSALLTFFIFIIGHFSASLRDFAQNLDSSAAKAFFEFLYYFLPNLSFFSFITNAANDGFPPAAMLGGAFLYAVIYVSILLAAAVLIFSRRNFK